MEKSFYNFKKNENILNHELKIIIKLKSNIENILDIGNNIGISRQNITAIQKNQNHNDRKFFTQVKRGELCSNVINNGEALLIYRRTYQKRLMELARNPDTTEDERNDFNKWKKEAQAQIKLYKKEKITEEELYKWMIENK